MAVPRFRLRARDRDRAHWISVGLRNVRADAKDAGVAVDRRSAITGLGTCYSVFVGGCLAGRADRIERDHIRRQEERLLSISVLEADKPSGVLRADVLRVP